MAAKRSPTKGSKKGTTVKTDRKRGLPKKSSKSKKLTRREHGFEGTISEQEQ